jgi:hypothetical protein
MTCASMRLGTVLWHASCGLFVVSGVVGDSVCGYAACGWVRVAVAECVGVREGR